MSQQRYAESQQNNAELNDAADLNSRCVDPVIEAYKKHVDRTILRENLKLSPQERSEKFVSFMRSVWQMRRDAEQSGRS